MLISTISGPFEKRSLRLLGHRLVLKICVDQATLLRSFRMHYTHQQGEACCWSWCHYNDTILYCEYYRHDGITVRLVSSSCALAAKTFRHRCWISVSSNVEAIVQPYRL